MIRAVLKILKFYIAKKAHKHSQIPADIGICDSCLKGTF